LVLLVALDNRKTPKCVETYSSGYGITQLTTLLSKRAEVALPYHQTM